MRLGRNVELLVILENTGYKSNHNKASLAVQHMERLGLVRFFFRYDSFLP